MICPFCGNEDTQVKDSRPAEDGAAIRRRRLCNKCDARFTTFERVQIREITIIKRDGRKSIFDREKLFIDELIKISKNFPNLKIIFEHISTKDAVQFVENSSDFIAATITPQHLVFNRNDLLSGGIRPHHYCLPVLKREEHRQALCKAAASGNAKFFLGSDSAPHFKNQKESSCGCAGIFSANNAIEIYLTIFDELNALEKFEDFATNNSCNFYGLEKSNKKLILEKKSQQIPSSLTVESEEIIPLMANQSISWSIVKEL